MNAGVREELLSQKLSSSVVFRLRAGLGRRVEEDRNAVQKLTTSIQSREPEEKAGGKGLRTSVIPAFLQREPGFLCAALGVPELSV